jgi:predicted DNA-binding transcriptional regulator YafY
METEQRPDECKDEMAIYIRYTNWEGKTSIRHIIPYPKGIFYGSTEWHEQKQWLLPAWDLNKNAERTFAMKDIQEWSTVKIEE